MENIEKKEFVIDRSKWRCGSTGKYGKGLGNVTALENNEGFQCCLGQIALQLGYVESMMIGVAEPYELIEVDDDGVPVNELQGDILITEDGRNTKLTSDAMFINDNCEYSLMQREKLLKERFAQDQLKLKFTGKSVKYKNDGQSNS